VDHQDFKLRRNLPLKFRHEHVCCEGPVDHGEHWRKVLSRLSLQALQFGAPLLA
jgi:hypothetical protein